MVAPARSGTDGTRLLPTFFLVGAARSGTSAIFDLLRRRPDVFVPSLKEPNYFAIVDAPEASPALRARSVTSSSDYERLYRHADPTLPRGDTSPEYLRSATAAASIAERVPSARIVAVLRNPVDRAWSDHQFHLRNGTERRPFRVALEQQAARASSADDRTGHYLDTGLYGLQVQRYLDAFDPPQVHVELYDDLIGRTAVTLRHLLDHIGAGPADDGIDDVAVWNASGAPTSSLAAVALRLRRVARPMLSSRVAALGRPAWERAIAGRLVRQPINDADRAFLADFYRDDVAQLGRLITRDLTSLWLS